jgi:hypothetical protein
MPNKPAKDNNQSNSEKRGFSLPTTSSKPPMPQVKPPKKESSGK